MSRDRVSSNDLHLACESLAIMLSARTASVTEALRSLQEAGLVQSYRSRLTMVGGIGLACRLELATRVFDLLVRCARVTPGQADSSSTYDSDLTQLKQSVMLC
jgi:hypothetical protein